MTNDQFEKLKNNILKEKRTIKEIGMLFNYLKNSDDGEEKKAISSQINLLKNSLSRTNEDISEILKNLSLSSKTSEKMPFSKQMNFKVEDNLEEKPTKQESVKDSKPLPKSKPSIFGGKLLMGKHLGLSELERKTIKRLKKKEKKVVIKKSWKPSKYVEISNRFFSNFSKSILSKGKFSILRNNLMKANLKYTPSSYVSMIFFTTLLSAIGGFFIFLFLLFFNIGAELPIITRVSESILTRFLKVFLVLFIVPIGAFFVMYIYPSMEKKSAERGINQELPFATIHMSAISSSMIEPSRIFKIIISTKEYPNIEKEFIKLINEINIYGYDLVSALRNSALNTSSIKLSELFNGIATTINSGGDLSDFFEKRSKSLLFEYRLEKEKNTKFAETFMDIYISVVIAAPMILMLLLMVMKIGQLGIDLSMSVITLIMVLSVSIINIVFLTFLQLKQPTE